MTATTASGWVLFVSHDETLVGPLGRQCQRERLRVERVASAQEAAAMLTNGGPDVVVLDLELPDEDGFDVMRRIRERSDVPVILLSENGAGVDEVVGLTLGADDFVPRSVVPRLFVARVRALLRRVRGRVARDGFRFGPLELDPAQFRASARGRELPLTLSEFRLLEALVRAAGLTLSRRQLLAAVSPEGDVLERTVDVHIANIRRKLATLGLAGLVETVRGVGYRLARPRG